MNKITTQHRTLISFVQPQPNSIQNKNNPIGCGTAPGNLVYFFLRFLRKLQNFRGLPKLKQWYS